MMARTVGSKNTKPQTHRLIAALIAELPRPNRGWPWPVKDRVAWLGMMEMAFNVAYGVPLSKEDVTFKPQPNGHAVPAEPADHAFYIDRENYARMAGGERINAVEVDGQLFDLRGEGDLGAIIWADGSTGVLGKVLDIKPA